VFLLLLNSVGIGSSELLVRLFRFVLLGILLIGAVKFHGIASILSMLLIVLLWRVGLIATFKEVVINLDSQVYKHIQILRVLINHQFILDFIL